MLHRQLLDVADNLLPLSSGRCTGVWRIQDRTNLVLAEQRVGLGAVYVEHALCIVGAEEIGDELHHLTNLLLQRQLLNSSLGRLHGADNQDNESDDNKLSHQKRKLLINITLFICNLS